MRYRRTDIVARAVDVLDQYGLADLSMRRIASELGFQPSALYHHFANKQELLAAVADEVLERGARTQRDDLTWDEVVVAASHELRDAMLAYRDGAELVATVHAFGLGTRSPSAPLVAALTDAGFDPHFAETAARTILHFTFGHASDEQIHLQANSAGAIDGNLAARAGSFDVGLGLIVRGIRQHQPAPL